MAGSNANTGRWFEPETPYGTVKGEAIKPRNNESKSTIYPFNKVFESESGHVIEIDDTPGSERIHQYHRSGTFEEVHPNGDKVTKVVRDNYVSILRDNNVHIDGFCNVTIDNGLKIFVNKDETKSTEAAGVNFDIHVGKNANVNVFVEKGNCNVRLNDGDMNVQLNRGDINMRQDFGNYNHFINGDYNLECTGHMHVVVGRDSVNEIGGSRDVRVDGQFDNLHVTTGYKETLVQAGDSREQVGGGKYEFYQLNHDTRVLTDRTVSIGGSEEQKVGISSKKTIGESSHETIGTGKFIQTGASLNVLTGGATALTSGGALDVSSPNMRLSSGKMDINGGSSLNATAGIINLNGPPARPAKPATPALPSVREPIYIPGPPGVWVPTVSTRTKSPISILQNITGVLGGQLAALGSLQGVTNAVQQNIGALTATVGTIQQQLTLPLEQVGGPLRTSLSGALDISQQVTGQISNTIGGATDVIDTSLGATGSALDATASATTGLAGGISSSVGAVSGGIVAGAGAASGGVAGAIDSASSAMSGATDSLSGLKDAFTGIGSVIGDVVDAIVEIGCAIGDFINGVIDAVLTPILNLIGDVLKTISEVLDAVNKFIGDILNKIGEAINAVLNAINEVIGGIIDAAGKFVGGILEAINGLIESLFDGVGNIGCGDGLRNGQKPDVGLDALGDAAAPFAVV